MNQVHAMCEPGYLENYELIEQGDSHYEVITNFLCDRCLLHLATRRVLSLLYRWCYEDNSTALLFDQIKSYYPCVIYHLKEVLDAIRWGVNIPLVGSGDDSMPGNCCCNA